MKKRRKWAGILAGVGIFVLCLAGGSPTNVVSAENGAEQQTGSQDTSAINFGRPSDGNYEMKVAENDRFELMANSDGTVAVLDKESGYLYETNPREEDALANGINKTNLQSQLYIAFASLNGNVTTKNSQTACVNKGWLSYAATADGGIRFNYDFQDAGIVIPVEYRLNEKGMKASVVVGEIEEDLENMGNYLTEISFLPYFGAVDSEATGYILVSDGSGALIYLNNEKASYGSYSQRVYGRDAALVTEKMSTEEETARIPVFGLKDGNRGFLAIISEGDTNATVNAMTSGVLSSYNNAYVTFQYRPYTKTSFLQGNLYASNGAGGDSQISLTVSPVIPEMKAFSVEYNLLFEEDLDYVDMAEVYREYLREKYGLSASGDVGNAPFYLNLLGGLEVEDYFLGIEVNKLESLTTFEQAEEIIGELMSVGIDNMVVKYSGWQKGGIESKIPRKIQFEKKLGGASGYQALVDYAEENGIELFMDFDFVNLYKSGNKVSVYSDAAQTVGSTPAYQYTYDYNLLTKNNSESWNLLTPARMEESVYAMLEKKEKLKGAQLALSSLGNTIYSDYTHKENGIDRADVKETWERIFDLCAEEFEFVMVDNGNAYTFPYVSHIYNAPMSSLKYDIEDEEIPFYQIVLHGLVSYSTEPVNLSAVPENQVLKAVETGSSLSACLMYAENGTLADTKYNYIYSSNYEAWINDISTYYDRTQDFLELVADSVITGHERVQEDVYCTTFANGVSVYVNYLDRQITVDGLEIPAKDFIYVEGGK
ncbi:MAG: DUF5696 domain-containing protein [Ruminococcus flavefaciens]|nr:DUF5696 domain-containing protein [Ruminococcus flavefaciens]